jgi:tetratricopeptide (TPR) repeat protein
MKIFVNAFLLIICLCCAAAVPAQTSPLWGDLKPGRHSVGFTTFYESDASRAGFNYAGTARVMSARAVPVSVWYPAVSQPSKTGKMKFREYLYSFDKALGAAEKSASESDFKKFTLALELPETAFAALLDLPTASVKDARRAPNAAKFPVVVVGQGLFYESPITHTVLCEYLASQGFIVATTRLAGAHSPFVKLDAVDLEAAVRDLEFVIARARKLPGADTEKLAVIGFDMGGLAASILAMRNADVDAIISLDSGITAEHNLRLVKQMPDYNPANLRVPLLHFSHPVEEESTRGIRGDLSFLDAAKYSEKLILRIRRFRHADYTSRSLIETEAAKKRDELTVSRKRAFEAAARYALAFLNANLKNDRQSSAFLYRENEDAGYAGEKILKENRKAIPAPMSEAEFLNRLYAGGAAKAREIYRRQKAQFPGEPLFSETVMNQVGYNRLRRGETAEAILIFTLNTEAFPSSASAFDSLAEAFVFAGDKAQAIKFYEKSLELNPKNENASRQLKRLREEK